MNVIWKDKDITQNVSTIEWSGADTEASRTLTFTVLDDIYGPGPKLEINPGDKVAFYPGKKMVFYGRVTGTDKTGEVGTISVTCRDYMDLMLRSKVSHKFKNKTAEHMAKTICAKVGIQCGSLIKTKQKIAKLFATDTPAYNIVMKAYKLASAKTGKKYFPYMDGTLFCVKEKGAIIGDGTEANFVIADSSQITGASVSQTIDNAVTRVVVYDKNGKQIGIAKNDKNIKAYGIYQETINTGKKGKKNLAKNLKSAKKKLHGKETTLQIEAIGDIRCIAGAGVRIQDSPSGIIGIFWIKSDSHTWENGIHKMTLQLVYTNTMENPSVSYQKPKKAKKRSSGGGGSSKFTGKFRWPVKGTVSSEFGGRSSPGAGASTYHQGIDIACGHGTPVRAAAAGTVCFAGYTRGYGYLVKIRHGKGFVTYYGHNARIAVKSGHVRQGQVIAYADNTGTSYGNHCHFGVEKGGHFVNPRRYLR